MDRILLIPFSSRRTHVSRATRSVELKSVSARKQLIAGCMRESVNVPTLPAFAAMSLYPTIPYLLSLALFVYIWMRKLSRRSTLPLPPGPRGLPIVGNLLDMPQTDVARRLHSLSEKYGDLVYMNTFGRPMIVIGSYDAAVALLDGRSINTSERPGLVMADLVDMSWLFALQGYTPRWRERRRIFHQFFAPAALPQYYQTHIRESRKLLVNLLDRPHAFLADTRRAIGGTIMDVVYGHEVKDENDEYVAILDKGAYVINELLLPGRYLVELIPALQSLPSWLPGATFKREIPQWKRHVAAIRNVPYDAASKSVADGVASPSMASTLIETAVLEHGSVPDDQDELFRDATGMAYFGGIDTSSIMLTAFFVAMAQYPDVQRKAQAELDAMIGCNRLPDFEDRDSLPYTNALIKECIRWHCVAPIGVAHKTRDDDEHNGYFIPGGSIVITNAWAMSRDPAIYPDPGRFMPERFLKEGKLDPGLRDPFKFLFGFGRRICPGQHFSLDTIFLTVASVLLAFDIQPPTGEDGRPIILDPKVTLHSAVAQFEPFDLQITPRSPTAVALIRQSLPSV
ncbi:O-methylsterigmatocystin oxidoreductase [Fomes fomentarius]|nr:O-methylsterigmatocystin oxidoreductase [Fomes fomentarius]